MNTNTNYVLTLSVPEDTFFGNDDDFATFDAFTDVMCAGYDHCNTDDCDDECTCVNPCPWSWSGAEDNFTIFIPEGMSPDEAIALFADFPITVEAIQTLEEWNEEFEAEFPELAAWLEGEE